MIAVCVNLAALQGGGGIHDQAVGGFLHIRAQQVQRAGYRFQAVALLDAQTGRTAEGHFGKQQTTQVFQIAALWKRG